ncbi:MAG TPA: hypothetical protein VE987_02625 [Polyangiaceae bacterium]|nr:hypothetical protein [Polyangiaceae bacterium]
MTKRKTSTKLTGRRLAGTAVASALLACAACTFLADKNATQCQSDADCAKFGSHPYCQSGVCVPSGLSPSDCFFGSPQQPQDFLNQCSQAQCLSFDNCSRLGLCDGGAFSAALVQPPAQTMSAPAPPADAGVLTLPSCVDPTSGRGQVVYITGSSNFPPLLSKLAPLVLAAGYTPVWQVSNSCTGVRSIFSSAAGDQTLNDPPPGSAASKYAAYYKADGTSTPCSLGPGGAQVDIGESDIFSTTCGFDPPGSTVGEYLGPIQPMLFVVPGKSQEVAITAEAARAVFGMGGGNGLAAPWINPDLYFVRNANTGTQQMIGHAIDVPANAFWGTDRGTAANVDALLRVISDQSLAEQAIGIISADYYDADRGNLKALAFKATGQECAYLPDSTPDKKDKRNVRDGHYPIWGPVHFFTAVSNGLPVSPGAQAFVSVISVPNIPKQLLDALIGSSLVPACAMGVQRGVELGPLSTYSPPFQCGCYFEDSVNGGAPAECTRCSTADDCTNPARPACNLGFCEVQ